MAVHSAAAPWRETVRHPRPGRGGWRPPTGNDLAAEEGTLISSLPAAVQAADIATSRLRTHVLRSGPGGAPALVLVHGNVSSARFFAETMAELKILNW